MVGFSAKVARRDFGCVEVEEAEVAGRVGAFEKRTVEFDERDEARGADDAGRAGTEDQVLAVGVEDVAVHAGVDRGCDPGVAAVERVVEAALGVEGDDLAAIEHHDVDDVGLPGDVRTAEGHAVLGEDHLSVAAGGDEAAVPAGDREEVLLHVEAFARPAVAVLGDEEGALRADGEEATSVGSDVV